MVRILANRVVDPGNWSGLGQRSIENMMVDLAEGIPLTDDQFQQKSNSANERRVRTTVQSLAVQRSAAAGVFA